MDTSPRGRGGEGRTTGFAYENFSGCLGESQGGRRQAGQRGRRQAGQIGNVSLLLDIRSQEMKWYQNGRGRLSLTHTLEGLPHEIRRV